MTSAVAEVFSQSRYLPLSAQSGSEGRPPSKDGPGRRGATLFLDDVGKMPLSLQSKLLGVIDPLGVLEEIPVDVRIVASSPSAGRDHVLLSALDERCKDATRLFFILPA